MKRVIGVLLVICISLAPNLKAQAISADMLEGIEETEEERTDKLILGICNALRESIGAEEGGCWRRTIHPFKMERYDRIVEVFSEMTDHFDWEMEVTVLDEDNFQISLENNNYLIKKGDTLSGIAKKYNTSISKILELNSNIVDENIIYYDTYLKMEDDWHR